MGADLYWKITPKERKEKYNCLSDSLRYFLKDYLKLEDQNGLTGIVLDKDNLKEFTAMYSIASYNNLDNELANSLHELITAIRNHNSITLEIRY